MIYPRSKCSARRSLLKTAYTSNVQAYVGPYDDDDDEEHLRPLAPTPFLKYTLPGILGGGFLFGPLGLIWGPLLARELWRERAERTARRRREIQAAKRKKRQRQAALPPAPPYAPASAPMTAPDMPPMPPALSEDQGHQALMDYYRRMMAAEQNAPYAGSPSAPPSNSPRKRRQRKKR